MTLQKDQPKPPQNRTQRIIMWSIFGVVVVLAIVAVVIFLVSGTPLF
jgi:t-SNARE complex subunit (syntaxin)